MDHQAAAEYKLKVADHLLSTTYPIVKDPKLLIGVIENLYSSMDYSITAVLLHESLIDEESSHERTHERTHDRDYERNHERKMELFRRKIIPKYSLDSHILNFVMELHSIIDNHKKSSVEFSKKEKFVISDEKYNLKTLTAEQVKHMIVDAKKYLHALSRIIIH